MAVYTTIDDPSKYFQTKIYTGNGGALAVTNDGNSDLQPDWAWFKKRSAAEGHALVDTSRGLDRFFASNSSAVEQHQPSTGNTDADDIASFNSDGFTFQGGGGAYNQSSNTYVAWQWKCNGGTTETAVNESGSNPANVRQTNTTPGFSIITYTGTGSAGTIAHGLGAIPDWIIVKARDTATDGMVYHGANTSAPETDALTLPESSATSDDSVWWNDTAPTSSVFTLGTHDRVNKDGNTYICYCFAEKQGYSKFGSYSGNNNADGPFVYTGFKPAWIMIKRTDNSEGWHIVDHKRDINENNTRLQAETTGDDDTSEGGLDMLSNGFKIRTAWAGFNADGATGDKTIVPNYTYMAFAENPFVSSKGVPTTAE